MDILRELDSIHWELAHITNTIDEHTWSRRLTRYDGDAINNLSKKCLECSNRIYNLREELKSTNRGE